MPLADTVDSRAELDPEALSLEKMAMVGCALPVLAFTYE